MKLFAVLMLALLGGCSNDGDNDDDEDDIEDSAALGQQDATSLRTIDPGVVTITVTDVDPDTGDTTVLVPDTMLDFSVGTVYTVVLTGTYEAPELVVFEKTYGDVDDSTEEAELHPIYLGSQGGIELIVAANDASGSNSSLDLSTQMPGTPFRVSTETSHEISLQGSVGEIPVYNVDSVSFAGGTRVSLIITDTLATNPPTVGLFVVFETGFVQAFTNLAQKPKLRFVNAVSDGDVDIEVRDSFSGDLISLTTLAFQQTTDYQESIDDSIFQDILVRRSEAPEEAPFVTVVSLEGEMFYTLVFGGSFTTSDVSSHLTQQIKVRSQHFQGLSSSMLQDSPMLMTSVRNWMSGLISMCFSRETPSRIRHRFCRQSLCPARLRRYLPRNLFW
ncbi:MAG: hypothetical protein ACI9UN_003171 [Granulosicoccus sp.]|jgi:hypothetical protein